jgi:hypothetical protein
MDAAETSLHPGFTPRGLAITLSIGLHLLVAWQLSHWLQTERDNLTPTSLRQPLRITIATPTKIQEKAPQQAALTEVATKQNLEKKPQPQKKSIDEVQTEQAPLHTTPSKPPVAGEIRKRTVSAAQIKQSAAAIARDFAEDIKEEEKQNLDSVSSTLERVLNKPRETPGIYTQANGITRVVTKNGLTYCIKALDDWRIIDPEDDMRVSMSCN